MKSVCIKCNGCGRQSLGPDQDRCGRQGFGHPSMCQIGMIHLAVHHNEPRSGDNHGKERQFIFTSLVKHAGKMKDNEAVSARRRPAAAGLRTIPFYLNFCQVKAHFYF